jgi:hypothetical protein
MLLMLPRMARASCGDYVHIGGHKRPTADQQTPRPPAPCHGPNCSRGPTQPPITPAPVPPATGERWAVPLGRLSLPQLERGAPADTQPLAHGVRRPSPPSPPPRLLSA